MPRPIPARPAAGVEARRLRSGMAIVGRCAARLRCPVGPAREEAPRQMRSRGILVIAATLLLLGTLVVPTASFAKTATEINASVDAAIARFDQQVKGGAKFLASSRGVLVFPGIVKVAFVL